MAGARAALVIASAEYQDPRFRQLRAPVHDTRALEQVLADPRIGGFQVRTLLDRTWQELHEELGEFFANRGLLDRLLLYFSCHGVKDASGRLYFATSNTRFDLLASTAISSSYVNERIDECRSSRKFLLLDCCYSGAFVRGFATRGSDDVDLAERFEGKGLAILTASAATEYSWEEDELVRQDAQRTSVFTGAVVRGLETGEADLDGDGDISLDELYEYVSNRMREIGARQTPTKQINLQSDIFIASSPRTPPEEQSFERRQSVALVLEQIAAHLRSGAVLSPDQRSIAFQAQRLSARAGARPAPSGRRRVTSGAIGIDIGVTECAMAVLEGGMPVAIPNAEGALTTMYSTAVAERGPKASPDPAPTGTLRLLGDAQPREAIIGVLRTLRRDAEAFVGDTVREAVVTVPSFLDSVRRHEVKDAVQAVGLDVLRVVSATTAASIAYARDHESEQTILVLDVRATSVEASIASVGDGVIEMHSTSGKPDLGALAWRKRVVDVLLESFRTEHGIDLSRDGLAMRRLEEAAESALGELADSRDTTVLLPSIAVTPGGVLYLEHHLTRDELTRLTTDLTARCRELVDQVIADYHAQLLRVGGGDGVHGIDVAVAIGQFARMPATMDVAVAVTGRAPYEPDRPELAVATGAALQAGILKGEVKDILPLDVIPHSLGIATTGGVMTRLIERNTTIPTKRSEVFTTGRPGQTEISVEVFEGESTRTGDNVPLGMLPLEIRRGSSERPQIEVTFDLDANGVVNVAAREHPDGEQRWMTVPTDRVDAPAQRSATLRIDESHRPAPPPQDTGVHHQERSDG